MSARPTCAVCGTEVDSMIWYDDDAHQVRVFIARCHGQNATTRLPFAVIDRLTPHTAIEARVEFPPLLTESKP